MRTGTYMSGIWYPSASNKVFEFLTHISWISSGLQLHQRIIFYIIISYCMLTYHHLHTLDFNTLRPRQNGRHFADDIFKCIFLNESVWIPIKISLKGPINKFPALVQIMAWRRPGDKPLSEPMMVSLPTHICVTRPQWVNIQWYLSKCILQSQKQVLHECHLISTTISSFDILIKAWCVDIFFNS